MVATGTVVISSDLEGGQEAVCFAALVKKTRGNVKRNQPRPKCLFHNDAVRIEELESTGFSRTPRAGPRERPTVLSRGEMNPVRNATRDHWHPPSWNW